jgi:hypothetical protein
MREFIATLSDAEREDFEERAGILEYDAGMPRRVAERRARDLLEARRGKGEDCRG